MLTNIYTEFNEIIKLIKQQNPRVIGIDGKDGTRKSALSKDISTKLDYKVISLDSYINKKKGGYFNFLNFKCLKKDTHLIGDNPYVIEGVMLFKILNVLNIKLDYCIYTTDSVWIYDWTEDYGGKYFNLTLEEIIKSVEEDVNKLNKIINPKEKEYKMKGFRKEIYGYTYQYKPWEKANSIYRVI